ncbi:Flp family type IVb pilin [Maritalea sp.]|jgi:pilus assembly protein Flp/PilA|uniref:Flp family type IVb pilin n=1 Tax=Maritalea sp. TaxID=2003361 RepID=UPI0039E33479
MYATIKRFCQDDQGATAVEYGLIAAVMAVVLIAAFVALGDTLGALFNGNDESIGGAMNNALS